MKAIDILRYDGQPPHQAILHNNVIETGEKIGQRRVLKCTDCGFEWKEQINAPQILPRNVVDEIDEYYPKRIDCTSL